MKIKWKINKKLNPNVILQKLTNLKSISVDGKVTFTANTFDYDFSLSALETMIDFPKETDGRLRKFLLMHAICVPEELNKENIEKKLNKLVNDINSKPESVFKILTNLSLSQQQQRVFNIEDCKIELLSGGFPENYTLARQTVLEDTPFNNYEEPRGYSKVIITVKEKAANRAVTKALRCLDLQRSIWEISSSDLTINQEENEWEPISNIRLGQVHTTHLESGEAASEIFHYEPNYVKALPINPWRNDINFEKNTQQWLTQLKKSKYSTKLKDSLLRYIRALDERDQNVALIKLWGAIESLTSPSGANGDLIIKRCSFLFQDYRFHRQVLEHLREYRNQSVHAGDQIEEAKNNCLQLRYYFIKLIKFHLSKVGEFDSLDKANEYLDLPPSKDELLRQKALIESALKFVG